MNPLEEGKALSLDFKKLRKVAETDQDVIPVVLQHAENGEVLFIGYANDLALQETFKTRQAVLWSTSRNELWRKGATSGDVLDLIDVRVNCEQNSVLYRVIPRKRRRVSYQRRHRSGPADVLLPLHHSHGPGARIRLIPFDLEGANA